LKDLDEDIDLRTFMIEDAIKTASPESLRELAAMQRAKGDLELAYDLETLADQRERGPGR
jgi:hypothetical protein